MAKEWGVKNAGGDEALNQKFLSVVSRPCPACKTSIEKNGGWCVFSYIDLYEKLVPNHLIYFVTIYARQ
jgi:hypothetical protein